MNKKIKILFISGMLFAISIGVFWAINTRNDIILLDDNFLINFVGVILGTDIAIITFIYSSLDKIEEHLKRHFSEDDTKKEKMLNLLYSSVRELVDDGKLIFGLFIAILLICVISYICFPSNFPITYLSKFSVIVRFFKVLVLVFLLYAIYDSVTALFNLIMVTIKSKNISKKNSN